MRLDRYKRMWLTETVMWMWPQNEPQNQPQNQPGRRQIKHNMMAWIVRRDSCGRHRCKLLYMCMEMTNYSWSRNVERQMTDFGSCSDWTLRTRCQNQEPTNDDQYQWIGCFQNCLEPKFQPKQQYNIACLSSYLQLPTTTIKWGEKLLTTAPTRTAIYQCNYRAQRAQYVADLQERVCQLEAENAQLYFNLETALTLHPDLPKLHTP
jgi:hypothetical protein